MGAEMKLMREVSELREKVLAEGKSVPALSTTASLVRPIATVSSHGMKLESYEGKYASGQAVFAHGESVMSGTAFVKHGAFTNSATMFTNTNSTHTSKDASSDELFMSLTGDGVFVFRHNTTELVQFLSLTEYSFDDKPTAIEARHRKRSVVHTFNFRSAEKRDAWSAAISNTIEA